MEVRKFWGNYNTYYFDEFMTTLNWLESHIKTFDMTNGLNINPD